MSTSATSAAILKRYKIRSRPLSVRQRAAAYYSASSGCQKMRKAVGRAISCWNLVPLTHVKLPDRHRYTDIIAAHTPLDMREDMRPFARACQLLRNKAPAVKQCKRLLRVQRSFHIRKFPEPGKQPRLGPLAHGVLPAALKKEDRLFFDAAGLFCLLDGERSPRAALFCKADCPQRTGIALRRTVWDAYTGSQVPSVPASTRSAFRDFAA